MTNLTLTQALKKLKNKEISSVELTKSYLERIKKIEPQIKAFVTVTEEEALKNAKDADEHRANGSDLPLLGIPLSIKDNFSTNGIRTTASSKVLDKYVPPFDATVVKKLKDAGMVMLGKTNMDAFAHGSSTETSDFGPSRNPWNTDHLPGGSSGGAAACVASDEAVASIGSETAGSIRQPASWCGVVGLKPTYGRISRYGVVAMGSSLDSPGPITKTVEDSALLLQILAGHDEMDATTSPEIVPNYLKNLNKEIKGLKIGVSQDYFEGVDSDVKSKVEDAIKQLEKMGAIIKKVNLFSPKYTIAVYTIIQRAEVSSNLARLDGIRYGNDRSHFGDEAKRRIMLGTYTLSSGYYDQYYNKALKVRTVIIEDFKKSFQDVDVIIGPTSPTTALRIGASEGQAMFGELADILVEPSSLAGLSGINVPVGFSKVGLPIGMQIIGPQFGEEIILNVAYKYEQSTEWHKQKPNL
jgi:aspartyl-tRNA(Asn)/glutamyl-tRNA(Gln) amidotransferase subunit A